MALAANSVEGKVEKYIARIETLLAEIESERGTFMAKIKEIRVDIKEIYLEAKHTGVPVKALKGIIKHRELARRAAKISVGMDIDEASLYETLVETLGELGVAAARAAGHVMEIKPTQKTVVEGRLDQEYLDKLGRGPIA